MTIRTSWWRLKEREREGGQKDLVFFAYETFLYDPKCEIKVIVDYVNSEREIRCVTSGKRIASGDLVSHAMSLASCDDGHQRAQISIDIA